MADEASAPARSAIERVPTAIAGLDEVLGGGFLRGGSYLVLGEPGTGKTTLGNQIAHGHARSGGVALYVTILAEAHDRMLLHLGGFAFFDPSLVGSGVGYLSLFDDLHRGGLEAALTALRRSVQEHHATLLVIDGAGRFEDFAPSRAEYRRLSAELHQQLSLLGCTTLLLAQPTLGADPMHTLGTHVDGILLMEDHLLETRATRMLLVPKMRGTDTLRGHHAFAITGAGVEVYPRLEAALVPPPPPVPRRRRHPLGIAGLDTVLIGGVLTGSTTLVVGPPGIGKTSVGLQFITEGAEHGERGLIAGFQEAPERLVAKAEGLGLGLGGHVEADRIRFLWQPSTGRPIDAWAGELLAAVAEYRPQRVLVDAFTDMARLATDAGRLPAFTRALASALRARGATTLLTAEVPTVEGTGLDVPLPEASATIDNAVLLRYVEPRSRLHRLVSVLRVRESGFDPAVREFAITDRGIEVDPSGEAAEVILTDAARRASGTSADGDDG